MTRTSVDSSAFVEVLTETDKTKFPRGIPEHADALVDRFGTVGAVAGSSLAKVRLSAKLAEGLDVSKLGTVYAVETKRSTHHTGRDFFSIADDLLHLNRDVPGIERLPTADWRMPSASAEFWNEAEFPRDTSLASHTLRYLAKIEEANADRSPYISQRVGAFTIANLYRMLELQGCVDSPGVGTQKRGRIPSEYRPQSALRDQLTADWGRPEWPVSIADDTSVLALLELVEGARYLDAAELTAFLGTKVKQIDGSVRTVGDAVGRLVDYVIGQAEHGDGLIFVNRDHNDLWMTWTDSVLAYQHADGTLPTGELAPVELQAWAHDALLSAAELLESQSSIVEQLGITTTNEPAHRLRRLAEKSATHLQEFVVSRPGEHWLSNALERSGEGTLIPLQKAHANMGLAINSRWIDEGSESPEKAAALVIGVAEKLSRFATNGGIPTMEKGMPGGYHNGSIWPWVQGYIAMAFAKRGLTDTASTLFRRALVERWGPSKGYGECIRSDGSARASETTIWTKVKLADGTEMAKAHPLEQLPEGDQMWSVVAYALARWNGRTLPTDPKLAVTPDVMTRADKTLAAKFQASTGLTR